MSYCSNCIHYKVCGNEGVDDSAMTFCADKQKDGDLISKSVLDQIKWERDIAIDQLKDLGYELGEKPRTDGDLISRQSVINALHNANINFTVVSTLNFKDYQRELQEIVNNVVIAQEKAINELPSAEKPAEWHIVGKTTLHYECSKCGGAGDKWDRYCPNCGRRMLGEQTE